MAENSDADTGDVAGLFEAFARQRVLVIGDLMLDWFIWGSVSRISPEAPVPVVEVQRENRYPGGAANVARNLTSLVDQVDLVGIYGEDANGLLLAESLEANGIGMDGCLALDGFSTITKTRVVARQQQVVRIDREKRHPISGDSLARLLGRIGEQIERVDGIILEDYGKGLMSQDLVDEVVRLASPRGIPVTVDPKPGNPIDWKGLHTVKPNRSEAFSCAGREDLHRDEPIAPLEDEPLLATGHQLRDQWQCENVLLTLGEKGMLLFSDNTVDWIEPRAREVFDVSGAGDTAIALYTLGICSGMAAVEAAHLANLGSSLVVEKLGTAPVGRDELFEAAMREGATR
ncbi:MAG: PfkB family carbohydrate kinase [Verrucomicrobiota bacterium]